jgi:hypothetical protein
MRDCRNHAECLHFEFTLFEGKCTEKAQKYKKIV